MIVWINLVDNSAPGMSELSDVRNVRFAGAAPTGAITKLRKNTRDSGNYDNTKKTPDFWSEAFFGFLSFYHKLYYHIDWHYY